MQGWRDAFRDSWCDVSFSPNRVYDGVNRVLFTILSGNAVLDNGVHARIQYNIGLQGIERGILFCWEGQARTPLIQ